MPGPTAHLRTLLGSLDPERTRDALAGHALNCGAAAVAVYEWIDGHVRRTRVVARSTDLEPRLATLRGVPVDGADATLLRGALADGRPRHVENATMLDDASDACWDPSLFQALGVRAGSLLPVGPQTALGCHALDGGALDHTKLAELAEWAAVAIAHAEEHARARRLAAHREQLLSVLAHDLGNPLTALRIAIAILKGSRPEDLRADALTEQLARIGASLDEMERLIEEVRDLRRITSGRLALASATHEAATLARNALETVAPLAADRRVSIRSTIDVGRTVVRADRRRLTQALALLLERAVRTVGGDGEVRFDVDVTDGEVRFAVEDDAPFAGRTDDPFEEFWTMPLGGGGHETAMRLALVAGIVGAHGGRVHATAGADGAGTTLGFSLPAEPAPLSD